MESKKNHKKGVLLVNLGTPRSSRLKDVYRYLTEFLTDGRVIDFSWLKRQLLVRGIIIPFRIRQSTKQYQELWTKEGSPLLVHSKALQKELQKELGDSFRVSLAMRYQEPSILQGLEELRQANVEEIIVFPLFPQYASATTGSVHQKVMEHVKEWQVIPKMTFINSYYDHPDIIEAFCARARSHKIENFDHVLFSFHGLPERQLHKANGSQHCLKKGCCQNIGQNNQFCYKAQCYATANAIAKNLNIPANQYKVSFQSRLGKEPWIMPYTSDVIEEGAASGWKNLLVFSPAFVADCLETTFEIGHEYAKEFQKRGGNQLQLVEGLNSHSEWVTALRSIIMENS